jgi:RNA polymerase sigma-70 factor (ECF subfamily)
MTDNHVSASANELTEEFVQLLSFNQPRIYAFVLALLPNAADADEVMQETSLHLWRRFSEYERGTNFRAWACQVARFKVLEFRRANTTTGFLNLSDELVEHIAEAAAQQADAMELRRLALVDCLKKLSSPDRDLIERRSRADVTMSQISSEVGRPIGGLYKAFERIYRALHECIERTISREKHS